MEHAQKNFGLCHGRYQAFWVLSAQAPYALSLLAPLIQDGHKLTRNDFAG
jgi:hypothetical protein